MYMQTGPFTEKVGTENKLVCTAHWHQAGLPAQPMLVYHADDGLYL